MRVGWGEMTVQDVVDRCYALLPLYTHIVAQALTSMRITWFTSAASMCLPAGRRSASLRGGVPGGGAGSEGEGRNDTCNWEPLSESNGNMIDA